MTDVIHHKHSMATVERNETIVLPNESPDPIAFDKICSKEDFWWNSMSCECDAMICDSIRKQASYFEVRKLLLNLGSFLTVTFQFFLETLFPPVTPLLIHAFVDAIVDFISFFVVFVIWIFGAQTSSVTFKLLVTIIQQIYSILRPKLTNEWNNPGRNFK